MKTPKHDYSILIQAEDDSFVARVPDLPGCVSEGETAAEALAGIDDAIRRWIAEAQIRGEPIPEPTTRRRMGNWTSE